MVMDTRDKLRNFIVNQLLIGHQGAQPGYDDDLLLSGLINSLGIMRLVAFAEEQFQRPIPPEDITIDNFATITTIAAYLDTGQSPS